MTVPHLHDTELSYVARWKESHMYWAKRQYEIGNEQSMWIQLFTWAMANDIYGEHWKSVKQTGEQK